MGDVPRHWVSATPTPTRLLQLRTNCSGAQDLRLAWSLVELPTKLWPLSVWSNRSLPTGQCRPCC